MGAIGVTVLLLVFPHLPLPRIIVAADIASRCAADAGRRYGPCVAGFRGWLLLAQLLAGSLPGIWLGSRLVSRTPERLIRSALPCCSPGRAPNWFLSKKLWNEPTMPAHSAKTHLFVVANARHKACAMAALCAQIGRVFAALLRTRRIHSHLLSIPCTNTPEFDKQFIRLRAQQFRTSLERWQRGELSDEQLLPLRLQNGWYIQRYAPMARIAVPYGEISSTQLRMLATSRDYDRPTPEPLAHAQPRRPVAGGPAWLTLAAAP